MHRQDQRYPRPGGDRRRNASRNESSGMSGGQGGHSTGEAWDDPLDFSRHSRHRSYADRLTEAWGGPNAGSGPELEDRPELPPERDYARGHWGGGSYSQPGWGHSMHPGEGERGSGMAGRGMPGHGGGPAGRGMSGDYATGQEQGFGHGFLGGQGFDQPSGHGDWAGRSRGGGDALHQQSFGATGYGGQQGAQGMRERKGPKGYVRSDERIKDDVCERLYHLHEVDVSEVSVEVQDGTVTLAGSVPERWQKHRIEDVIEHCLGVRDIENRLRVNKAGGSESSPSTGSEPQTRAEGTGRGKRQRH